MTTNTTSYPTPLLTVETADALLVELNDGGAEARLRNAVARWREVRTAGASATFSAVWTAEVAAGLAKNRAQALYRLAKNATRSR